MSCLPQVAEEVARRCFRDNLLSKAVRECGKPAALSSLFANQQAMNAMHQQERLQQQQQQQHRGPDLEGRIHADRLEKSSNNSGSHSTEESSSTEEALSRRSVSPPVSVDLDQHPNQHHHNNRYNTSSGDQLGEETAARAQQLGTVVESSCGRIAYLSSAQMNNMEARFSTDQSAAALSSLQDAGCSMDTPLQNSGEGFFRELHHHAASTSGMQFPGRPRQQHQQQQQQQQLGIPRPLQSRAPDHGYTRWLATRSALPQDQEFLMTHPASSALPLSRFSSEVHAENYSQQQQGSDTARAGQSVASANKVDRVNLGFQQGLQENMAGYRSFSTNPLTPNTTGSILDITTPHAIAGYQLPNSMSPNGMLTSFSAGPLAGTSTGMRLHEYEVPSPRMVLWDFQE